MIITKSLSNGDVKISEHFKLSEFKCPGTNTVKYDTYILAMLEKVRAHFGGRTEITSGCRTKAYSLLKGFSLTSAHNYGQAADFKQYKPNDVLVDSKEVCLYLESIGYQFGIGYIASATHIDSRYTNRMIEYPKPYKYLNRLTPPLRFSQYWNTPMLFGGDFPTATVNREQGTAENIIRWQTYLCWYGLKTDIDGEFGTDSEKQTAEFQRQNGLKIDGSAGPTTRRIAKTIKR